MGILRVVCGTAPRALNLGAAVLASSLNLQGADLPLTTPQFSPQQIAFYEKNIQPILAENCYRCHSHQADRIKGGLVLDSREGLLKGGEDGAVVVLGDPAKSLLIKAVRQVDPDLQMPPKKKLSAEQIALLIEWVKMGTPYAAGTLTTAGLPKRKEFTAADRHWWSLQPIQKPTVPAVQDGGSSRNEIDHFIFAKLTAEGLHPAPEADRRTLARRTCFDLLGLPPTAEQVEELVRDKTPDWYARWIETLLNNAHYGEKLARYWLDLVRYAESDGYKSDAFRPNAWRYRDYVISSFNQDKPYNRFIMEQIAADELWPDDPDALAGLSYLRLWIYEYNQRNVKAQWATILNDITDVSSDVFLGLGLQCARCHDHKFDPILQRDYYRFQAFFAALWPRDDVPLATPSKVRDYAAQLASWEEKTATTRARIERIERPVRERVTKAVVDKLPKEIQRIINQPESERTPYEQQLFHLAYRQVAEELEKLDGKFKAQEREQLEPLEKEMAEYDAFKPKPLPIVMLATDIGPKAPPTTIPKDKSQTPVEPGFLTILDERPVPLEPAAAARNSTGRRATLAKWLAANDNRFTARVMVNRLWQRHFGRGLVATPSDFGRLGEAPSHPELLDWLASYFVAHDWSIKAVDRLIVTSATYRQSSRQSDAARTAPALLASGSGSPNPRAQDPGNRWLWRQNLRRLQSDELRDTLLQVSGELDEQMGGPSVDASKPRRTVYAKCLRNSRDPLVEVFDPPDPYISTPQRNVTTTPLQSLVLLNGPYVLQRAKVLASRIENFHPANDAERARLAYRLVYQREPSAAEQSQAAAFIQEQAARIAKSGVNSVGIEAEPMPGHPGMAALFQLHGGQTRLQVPDNHLMPQYDFTLEAFVVLRSVDATGQPRTIASRWDGRKNQPGWSLSVNGSQGIGSAQCLALELIGDSAEEGEGGYEKIVSDLRVPLGVPCFVAVSVRLGDTSESGVTFYLKELKEGGPLHSAHVAHHVTADHQSNLPLLIGGRDPEKNLLWDGLIDDVRLSARPLKAEELLLNDATCSEGTVGYWRFEAPDRLRDSSSNGHNIRAEVSPTVQLEPPAAALADFCHILLNSNEFLYVD